MLLLINPAKCISDGSELSRERRMRSVEPPNTLTNNAANNESAGRQLTMPDLHSLPEGCQPNAAVRHNGPNSLAIERWKLRELAEGWPCYRYKSVSVPDVQHH